MIIDYVDHLQCTVMNVKPMFSLEAMVCSYNEYHNAFDAPIGEILSCETEVGNTYLCMIPLY